VTRALIGLFAPREKLSRAALIAAGITCVSLLVRWNSTELPCLAILLGWILSGSFSHLAISELSWERAWPVAERLLWRLRIFAAWLVGWVPGLALLIAASALYALGVVSARTWAGIVFHTSCILGLVPLASAVSYRLSQRKQGSPSAVALLILLPDFFLAAIAPPFGGESSSVSTLLGLAVVVGGVTGAAGFLLTPTSWARPRIEPAQGRKPLWAARQLLARVATLNPLRRAPIARFFFLNGGRHAVFGWVYLLFVTVLARFEFPALLWYLAATIWFQAYSGSMYRDPIPGHLPVSRGRVLAYLLAPLAVSLLSGLWLERRSPQPLRGLYVQAYYDDWRREPIGKGLFSEKNSRILVPSSSWRASWGEPPLVTTPEGVSRRPAALAVLPGLPLKVYNPYDARLDDEPAFVNYQVSRALSAQWPLPVSAADVERACGALRRGRMSPACLNGEFSTGYHQPRAWLAVECWLLCLIALFALRGQLQDPRSRNRARRWSGLLWLPPAIVLPMAIEQVGKNDPTTGLGPGFQGAVLLGELTRVVERAPVAASVIGLMLLAGTYGYVARCFARTESRPSARAHIV